MRMKLLLENWQAYTDSVLKEDEMALLNCEEKEEYWSKMAKTMDPKWKDPKFHQNADFKELIDELEEDWDYVARNCRGAGDNAARINNFERLHKYWTVHYYGWGTLPTFNGSPAGWVDPPGWWKKDKNG